MIESPVRFATNQVIKKIIRKYCPKINTSILDVGCGGGYHAFFEAANVKGEYLGIDIKEDRNWAKQENLFDKLKVSFKVHDAEDLSKLNKKFNFICSFQCLEHVKNDKKVIREMVYVLRNQGFIFLTIPSKPSFFVYGLHGRRRYSIFEIKKIASQNNLEIEKIIKLGGMVTFFLHFILWTLWAIVFKIKIWKIYQRLGLTHFIRKMENLAIKLDRFFPFLEGGYAVILKKATT